MRSSQLVAGVMAGVAIGLAGALAADLPIESADAQGSGQFVTKAEFNAANKSANARASAAINGYKIANNAITKYFIPDRDLIGAKSGPITQERGTGSNGLPGSTIQNGAIAREKIQNEAVDSEKIAPGGVTSGDLADDSVTNSKIQAAAVGEGELSAAVQAKLNTKGLADRQVLKSQVYQISTATSATKSSDPCPDGSVPLGGGLTQVTSAGDSITFLGLNENISLIGSFPATDGQRWRVQLENQSGAVRRYVVNVVCATPGT